MNFFRLLLVTLLMTQCSFSSRNVSRVMISPVLDSSSNRLSFYQNTYSDVDKLIREIGKPDCIAEIKHSRYRYVIFYYLKDQQQLSFRIDCANQNRIIEISNPCKITKKEYQLLSRLKK
jgi:hypothetical protein